MIYLFYFSAFALGFFAGNAYAQYRLRTMIYTAVKYIREFREFVEHQFPDEEQVDLKNMEKKLNEIKDNDGI